MSERDKSLLGAGVVLAFGLALMAANGAPLWTLVFVLFAAAVAVQEER